MSIALNGTTGYLEHLSSLVSSYPASFALWVSASTSVTQQVALSQGQTAGNNAFGADFTGFDANKRAFSLVGGNSGAAMKTGAPNPSPSTMRLMIVVFVSQGVRRVMFGSNTVVTETYTVVTNPATHDRLTVGALNHNSAGSTLFLTGSVAEVHGYSAELVAADYDAMTTGTMPEAITGWVDGWTLQTYSAGGTYTSIGGSRTLTAVGGVSSSGLGHPITRSSPSVFTGNITLDAVGTSGTFQGVAAGAFAGAITLDDAAPTGSFGASSGTLTSEALRTNNGTLLASTALAHVAVYNDTTGALVLRRTNISTDGAGVFTVTDPAIVAGVTYRIDWETSGGHRRMPRKLAA